MKLMLRPEWRLWPFSSFLGLLDLKTGVTVALLFALLNKVAGIYGLIAVLTGAGGSFAQLSLYVYSALALVALSWGLRAVKEEDPKHTLYFAHLFFADHIFSTAWTIFFAVVWWLYTPHDGRRQANSDAQKAMMEGASVNTSNLTDAQREQAAMSIWDHEKGTAAAIIILSWIAKIYFALLLYSYATHLRQGSYRSLPLTRTTPVTNHAYDTSLGLADEEEEIEDFYRVPLRSHHTGAGSISSFADFISAPERARRSKTKPRLVNGDRGGLRNGDALNHDDDDVIFDENDSSTYASSSRPHSKMGTEDSTVIGTDDERGSVRGSFTGKGRD